jgi:starvation-inducible DNA-binding protein
MKEAGCGCDHEEEDVVDIELLDDVDIKALPFDIDTEGENPLATALKQVLANTYTFFFRTSGFHWNVTGPDFSQYHALFGEIYNDAFGAIDPIAEDIRKLGAYSPYKIEEFMRLRSISDTMVESDPQSLAKDLLAANELMLVSIGEAFDLASRMDEQGIANFLAERIDMHEKWRWQLKASISNSGQIKADPFMMENDFEEAQDSDLVQMLKTILSDTVSLYFKAHGYHWNVETQDFSQYHALFSEIYDDTLSAVDPTAENIRKLGAFSPFRLTDFVQMRTIQDTNVSSEPQLMASDLASANDMLIRNLMEAFDVANEANEQGIANFLAERIDSHQKWRWQLRSSTEAAQLLKNATLDEIMTKAGRVLNGRNLNKLRQAIELIQGVVSTAGAESIEMKTVGTIAVTDENLEGLVEAIEPVVDYYELDAEITDSGVEIKDFANVSEDAKSALHTAIGNFVATEVEEKGFFTQGRFTEGKEIGGRIGHMHTPGGNWRPHDGDGDGMFSPGPGMPDRTPVPPGMDKFAEEIQKLTDPHLRNKLKKARREHDEMADGPEKVKKKFEIGAMEDELGHRIRAATGTGSDWEENRVPLLRGNNGDRPSRPSSGAKPDAPKPVKRGDPNPRSTGKEFPKEPHELVYGGKLGPYPASGTEAEQAAWKKAYAEKIRYMKKEEFSILEADHRVTENQSMRDVIKETEEEKITRRKASEIVAAEKARRREFARSRSGGSSWGRSGGSSSRGSSSRPGMTRYRRTDGEGYVWYDDNTDDAYDAMRDGFIEGI